MSLSRLPLELYLLINEHLDPFSQFTLSATSKHFYESSQDSLAANRRTHALFNRCSDYSPDALTHLLQTVVGTPSAAWHIRTFDLRGPSERHTYTIKGVPINQEFNSFITEIKNSPDDLPLASNHAITELRKQMSEAGAPMALDTVYRAAEKNKFDAHDVLLAALCPNLQAIQIVNFPPNHEDEYEDERSGDDWIDTMILHIPEHRPYSLLCNAIRSCHDLLTPVWPRGFRSLRKIFIRTEGFRSINPYSLAPILMLPNINTLHVPCFHGDNIYAVTDHIKALLPPKSSSVQHLSFGGAQGRQLELVLIFAVAARNLKTLILHEQHAIIDALGPLGNLHESSLERLILYGENCIPQLNRHFRRVRPLPGRMDILSKFNSMQVLSLDLWDLINSWGYRQTLQRFDVPVLPTHVEGPYVRFLDRLIASIPRSIRVLIFHAVPRWPFFAQDLTVVDDAFYCIVNQNLCPDLAEIYMDELKDVHVFSDKYPSTSALENDVLRRTSALARQRGIKVVSCAEEGATEQFTRNLIDKDFRV